MKVILALAVSLLGVCSSVALAQQTPSDLADLNGLRPAGEDRKCWLPGVSCTFGALQTANCGIATTHSCTGCPNPPSTSECPIGQCYPNDSVVYLTVCESIPVSICTLAAFKCGTAPKGTCTYTASMVVDWLACPVTGSYWTCGSDSCSVSSGQMDCKVNTCGIWGP
jgi:hypothetical protein